MSNMAPASDEPAEITRPILTRLNEDGSQSAQSVLTPTNMKVRAECLITSRLVIPVIFLPGVMGTRLRSLKNPEQTAWAPPENTWEKLLIALSMVLRGPGQRQMLLDPRNTEVDDTGPAQAPPESAVLLGDVPGDTDAERLKRRGWGQLYGDSYGPILNLLQQRLSDMMQDGCRPSPAWQSAVMDWQEEATDAAGETRSGAQRLGAQKDFQPIDEAALRSAASAHYPVYAVGYNWLKSNAASGEHLETAINDILAYYTQRKKICEKVILVTHSMGGFVARACLQRAGMQDKVLGVMHGVMPALGAPAVYKRMRAGFEKAEQVVLGRDAAEATAVMANGPGLLELLPNRQYKTRDADGIPRHWLRASHAVAVQPGMPKADQSTPLGEGDIYSDIYLNNRPDSWWRMVKEELINPAKLGDSGGGQDGQTAKQEGKEGAEEDTDRSDFKRLVKTMKQVKDFHDSIEDKYHPVTYAHYAADAGQPSWSEVQWKCDKPVEGAYVRAELASDDHNGAVKITVGERIHKFAIQAQTGPGDGTVPVESGAAPTPHTVQIFKHEGRAKGHTSYDHQNSYNADVVQAATLYAVTRIAADSEWLQANKSKA